MSRSSKCIRDNRYTDTNETFRVKGVKGNFLPEVRHYGPDSNDAVRYIEVSLLCTVLSREDGCLSDIELQTNIFFGHRVRCYNLISLREMYPPRAM